MFNILVLIYEFIEYFLEDCVQMLGFEAPPETRKRKGGAGGEGAAEEGTIDEPDENMNKYVSDDYSVQTKRSVALLNEKDISFELIEVCEQKFTSSKRLLLFCKCYA